MNNTQSLEQRITRLEDIEAIIKLTSTYALYVNKGWNKELVDFDKLPSLFAPDAEWKCSAMNVDVSGIGSIIEMLKEKTEGGDFAMHSFTNPIIEVNGDAATGNWLLWVAVKAGNIANEVFQSEDLTYVRTPQGWRIQSIDLHFGTMLVG